MSVDKTQRDEETTVLPVADDEETTVLPVDDAHTASPTEQSEHPTSDVSHSQQDDTTTTADTDTSSTSTPAAPAKETAPPTDKGQAMPHPSPVLPLMTSAGVQEAPANGVRVAQLVWAGLVIMLGVFMIAISFLRFVSIPLLLISLIAALGIALMAAAVVTSVKKG